MSSLEQEIFHTTSLDENCIEFEFQTDRNYYVDLRQTYLALKVIFDKVVLITPTKSKKLKKELKEEIKADDETEEEQQKVPVPLVTHANNILHSVFSNVEV